MTERWEEFSDLARAIETCRRCDLRDACTQRVPGVGSVGASIMLVGEAPGFQEDKLGVPFVGKSGKRLDQWLALADLKREHLYITNVLKCAPIADVETEEGWKRRLRFPEDTDEPETCMYWLRKQLQLIRPRAVILTGKRALHHVLCAGSTKLAEPFSPWVGSVCRRRDLYGETRFGISYHPAFILRNRNPYDEQACVDVFREIREYVVARQDGRPAPVGDLVEVRPAPPPQLQQRFRLFKDVESTSGSED